MSLRHHIDFCHSVLNLSQMTLSAGLQKRVLASKILQASSRILLKEGVKSRHIAKRDLPNPRTLYELALFCAGTVPNGEDKRNWS